METQMLFSSDEVCQRLFGKHIKGATLRTLRAAGKGPAFVVIPGGRWDRIYYTEQDVRDWVMDNRFKPGTTVVNEEPEESRA